MAPDGARRVGLLGDRDRGVDDGHVRRHLADLGRGAEQHDADALHERRSARDLSGTPIGPVDVYRTVTVQ